jgi:hypothetical protein
MRAAANEAMLRTLLVFGSLLLLGCGTFPGGPKCGTTDLGIEGLCVPDGGALANTPLTLQVREGCGSLCGKNPVFACTATLDAGTIFLSATVNECIDQAAVCPAACRITIVDCALPALAPGTYPVVGDRTGATRQLVVVPDGGSSSCAVGFP